MSDLKKDNYPKRTGIEGIVKYKKLSQDELAKKVILAKNGDELAFKEILSSMHYFLLKLKDRFYIQGSDNEDVYQEGAIKLMNVIEKFDPNKGNFSTFAQQAIEKHIITCINREKAQKRIYLNNALSLNVGMSNNSETDENTTFLDNLCDENPSDNFNPIEIVEKDYELFLIEEISKCLSKMEAKVFYLRFIEHYSYKDIAIELGFFKKSKGKALPDQKSVDNAIMRSRPKIKKVLERMGLSPKDVLNEGEKERPTKKKKTVKKPEKKTVKKPEKKTVKKSIKKEIVKKKVVKKKVVKKKVVKKKAIKKKVIKKKVIKKKAIKKKVIKKKDVKKTVTPKKRGRPPKKK